MSSLTVLTPNGRRQNVKVQPNTTILQVLEEVCQKHTFDATEYDLKHHKRILDLSLMYRFTGLPNNAHLEMVEAQKKRQEQDVMLVVQLVDNSRVEGTFKPSVNLGEILHELCPAERAAIDIVVIYMRTEITHDRLATTTLKQLGLVGGRAIMRLIRRDPTAKKTQANVSSVLVARPQPKPEDTKDEPKKFKAEETLSAGSILSSLRAEAMPKSEPEPMTTDETMEVHQQQHDAVDRMDEDAPPVAVAEPKEATAPSTSAVREPEREEDPGDIQVLGERSAVLFSLETSARFACDDMPDSFFDLNVKDIKNVLRDLRSAGKGSIDQPMMTAEMRELGESTRQLDRLNRYKKAIIRVQFPNRYVLQAIFTPMETVQSVIDFVRTFLIDSQLEFHLFTTPPKMILPAESRLFEVNCVPSAILHFGTNDKCENPLRDDVLAKVSSPSASLFLALKEREMKVDAAVSDNEPGPSNVHKPKPEEFRTSSAATSNEAKVPRWFKPAKI